MLLQGLIKILILSLAHDLLLVNETLKKGNFDDQYLVYNS